MQMASVSLQLAEPLFAHKLDHDYEGGHFMTILSHGAENVHSQVWQRSVDRPLNVLLLD